MATGMRAAQRRVTARSCLRARQEAAGDGGKITRTFDAISTGEEVESRRGGRPQRRQDLRRPRPDPQGRSRHQSSKQRRQATRATGAAGLGPSPPPSAATRRPGRLHILPKLGNTPSLTFAAPTSKPLWSKLVKERAVQGARCSAASPRCVPCSATRAAKGGRTTTLAHKLELPAVRSEPHDGITPAKVEKRLAALPAGENRTLWAVAFLCRSPTRRTVGAPVGGRRPGDRDHSCAPRLGRDRGEGDPKSRKGLRKVPVTPMQRTKPRPAQAHQQSAARVRVHEERAHARAARSHDVG